MVFLFKKHAVNNDQPGSATRAVPRHVALIMDGNGRWAESRGLPRVAGHKQGMDAVRMAIRAAAKEGIEYLTLYAFSSENWARPADEVSTLMDLLRSYIRSEIEELDREGVCLRFIGRREDLAEDIRHLMLEAEERTNSNRRIFVQIALSYGSRTEIVDATRQLAQRVKDGTLEVQDIDAEMISGALYTNDIPDPDLIIRTSGEHRLSNFLLWQSAYAELVFLDEHWPVFDANSLARAIDIYSARDRRFGGRR